MLGRSIFPGDYIAYFVKSGSWQATRIALVKEVLLEAPNDWDTKAVWKIKAQPVLESSGIDYNTHNPRRPKYTGYESIVTLTSIDRIISLANDGAVAIAIEEAQKANG